MKPPDPARMEAFAGKLTSDAGAAFSAVLAALGDRLGIFKAMADGKPTSAGALAERTGLDARYLSEWLCGMAAAGYVDVNAKAKTFRLNSEQAAAFADDGGPGFFAGAFEVAQILALEQAKIAEAYKSGAGVSWQEHKAGLHAGVERFYRPHYNAHLVSRWIPALKGVKEKLDQGARVADVGCGHGAATILMALAFPRSKFFGFDFHAPSVTRATQRARDAGVSKRVTFAQAEAAKFPGEDYDLVVSCNSLHSMGDPVGAGARVREALSRDGVWMIVEPAAGDDLTDNMGDVGRIYYAASAMLCAPAARAQGGAGLGAQAGEKRLRKVAKDAGFTKFRRAAETPYSVVFEART